MYVAVGNAAARVCNLQRLLRGLFYSLCAAAGGLCATLEYRHWPHDLLFHSSHRVTLLLEGAVAHWILSLYEDYAVGSTMVSE
jgi:hypothetical protein